MNVSRFGSMRTSRRLLIQSLPLLFFVAVGCQDEEDRLREILCVPVQVTPRDGVVLYVNEQVDLSASTDIDCDFVRTDVTATSEWFSEDAAIAEVFMAAFPGRVRGVAPGKTFVGVRISDQPHTVPVEVRAAGGTLHVVPTVESVGVGGSVSFRALFDPDGAIGIERDVTDSVRWSSDEPDVASVGDRAGDKGVATGLKLGQATVRAIYRGLQATAELTVDDSPPPGATAALALLLENQSLRLHEFGPNGLPVPSWIDTTIPDGAGALGGAAFGSDLYVKLTNGSLGWWKWRNEGLTFESTYPAGEPSVDGQAVAITAAGDCVGVTFGGQQGGVVLFSRAADGTLTERDTLDVGFAVIEGMTFGAGATLLTSIQFAYKLNPLEPDCSLSVFGALTATADPGASVAGLALGPDGQTLCGAEGGLGRFSMRDASSLLLRANVTARAGSYPTIPVWTGTGTFVAIDENGGGVDHYTWDPSGEAGAWLGTVPVPNITRAYALTDDHLFVASAAPGNESVVVMQRTYAGAEPVLTFDAPGRVNALAVLRR